MSHRKAFTLVELVVVVLILGILAAVAAPKIVNNSDDASDSSVQQSLAVIRDAIELYRAENNGEIPGGTGTATETSFKADVDTYIRGNNFPRSPVGTKDSDVSVVADGSFNANNSTGWMYNKDTGEFIINSNESMPSQPNVDYDDL